MKNHRLWLDGKWTVGTEVAKKLLSPYDERETATVEQAGAAQMEEAIAASRSAFETSRKLSRHVRSRLLARIADGIRDRRADIVELMIAEAGKPRTFSDGEVTRAITTFTVASEEAKRFGGEVIPMDLDAGGRAYSPAVVHRFPRGPVLAIAPFNFPLNLAAHKVAPAIAVGASVILKPPPQAPGAATVLAAIFEKAAAEVSDTKEKIPLAMLQVLNCSNDVAGKAVADPRLAILSFTGSDRVGFALQAKAVRKKVALELGGNAGVIVHSDADVARAAARCAYGAFAYAGQVCISVQRIFVHEKVYDAFQEALLKEVAKLGVGDPSKAETSVGPLIDRAAAERVESWIKEAQGEGAKLLTGGERRGSVITPAVLSNVKATSKLSCEEAFGPVVTLEKYREIGDAIAAMNGSRYGLQAGLFTDSAKLIERAFNEIEVGGLLVNEVPTYRGDHMPYGGVKDSGIGREGLRYAMEEFSEPRILISWNG